MEMDKLLSLLGMCRRAGRLEIGFEKCEKAIQSKKAKLIVCANDLSKKTQKEIKFSVEKNGNAVPVIVIDYDKIALSNAIGTPAGVTAICDSGFAERTLTLYQTGGNAI